MKVFSLERFLLTLLLALLLISCSGGGASSNSGGIGGSGMTSQGSVSGFGSIIVNGTEFDTTNARVIVEGQEIGIGDIVAEDNLEVGMVVTVYGTDSNNPVAERVTYNDNVEGPVESITPVNATRKDIVVLGQTVIVNVVTEFKGTTFDTLAVDDVVEVSGYYDDNYDIIATYVEVTSSSTHEITGRVTGIFSPGVQFFVNGLLVVNSSETVAINDYVEVKGSYSLGIFTASSVESRTQGYDIDDEDIVFPVDLRGEDDAIAIGRPIRVSRIISATQEAGNRSALHGLYIERTASGSVGLEEYALAIRRNGGIAIGVCCYPVRYLRSRLCLRLTTEQ